MQIAPVFVEAGMGRSISRCVTALFLAAAILSACGDQDNNADQPAAQDTAAAPAMAAPAPILPDGEIAHVAITANSIDAEMGDLAKAKAKSEEVRAFAEAMVREHRAVNTEAAALVKRLNITPTDNASSKQMHTDAQRARQFLEPKSGDDFDRSYISQELLFHQQVVNTIDNSLLPNVQNAELKAFLEKVRTAVAEHLQRAEQVQQSVMK